MAIIGLILFFVVGVMYSFALGTAPLIFSGIMFVFGSIVLTVQVAKKKFQNKQPKNGEVNKKDKLWLMFIISGILGIIAFIYPFDIKIWFWVNYPRVTLSIDIIIGMLLILGSVLLLIITGIYSKITQKHNLDPLGLLGSLFLLFAPIAYVMELTIPILNILYKIPLWVSLIGGILGLIALLLGLKYNKLNKISIAGMILTSLGFLAYLVKFFIPFLSSWAYYYVVGPTMTLIGFVILVIGLIKSMLK